MPNAQERLDYLLETVETPNDTAWTIKKLADINPSLSGKIEVSLKLLSDQNKPFSLSTLIALSTAGGLSLNGVDDLIDQLAAYSQSLPEELRWDAAFVQIVKSLGVRSSPRWQSQGYAQEPTLEQVQAEIDAVRQEALLTAKQSVVKSLIDHVDAATTIEQLVIRMQADWPQGE